MSKVQRRKTFDLRPSTLDLPRSPLIVFAGGGTGGHLFPALAVMDVIRRSVPKARFLLFATDRSIDERIVRDGDCELVRQSLPGGNRRLRGLPATLLALQRSGRVCRNRLANDRPSVVIGSGGFSALAALREAHRLGVPILLLNPDSLPGRVNRCFASTAEAVFVQWADTKEHFPAGTRVIVSGCPVRRTFRRTTRESGIERFSLEPDRKTLLVTGASQGARTINEAVVANLDLLASFDDWQVLHLTGDAAFEAMKDVYARRGIRATVLPFSDHMAEALAAADLVVSRAGASTLAEITAIGTASILMPYPFHRDGHQMANASCLARSSAAVIVRDSVDPVVNGPALRQALGSLMGDAAGRIAMADAAKAMGGSHAADRIAESIIRLVFTGSPVLGVDSLEHFGSLSRYESGVGRVEERAATCEVY